MVKLKVIFYLVVFLIKIQNGYGRNQSCPIMCECYEDIFDDIKKVDCINKKLISANVEAPIKSEWLDLGSNTISILDEQSFQDLPNVRTLYLNSNNIHTIYLNAFADLKNLASLDLSNNVLTEFDERIFERNSKLKTLNLSRNKFWHLLNKPFLISKSIEILNLKECHIVYIYEKTFEKLPNLKALDLSHNLMNMLTIDDVHNLNHLNWINLNKNEWKCDTQLDNIRNWFMRADIEVLMNDCVIQRRQEMKFERMQVEYLPKNKNRTIEPWTTEDDPSITEKSARLPSYLVRECPANDTKRSCDLLTECRENYFILTKDARRKINFEQHMKYNLWIMFALGIILGSIVGASLVCLFNMITHGSNMRHKRRNVIRRSRTAEETTFTTPINDMDHETPIVPVRTRHSMHPAPPSKPSFLASLFQRRRVYRYPPRPSLIRRLSRSNLFTSTMRLATSQSAARAAERQNSRSNQNGMGGGGSSIGRRNRNANYGELLLNSNSDLESSTRDLPSDRNSFNLFIEPHRDWRPISENATSTPSNRLVIDFNDNTSNNEILPRCETPPPLYTDCIIKVRK